jgi:hypothetical protein
MLMQTMELYKHAFCSCTGVGKHPVRMLDLSLVELAGQLLLTVEVCCGSRRVLMPTIKLQDSIANLHQDLNICKLSDILSTV